MKIIINADDYGRDKKTTNAIVDCFLNKKITSTTLMVVHEDCVRAAKIAKEEGFAVGLHLCLDEGRPVSEPHRIPSMLSRKGELNVTLKKLSSGKIKINELCLEIASQIEKISELGLKMTHVDSHHHLHCHPMVLWALRKIGIDSSLHLKIRSIRNFEPCGSLREYGFPKFIYKKIIHFIQKRFFTTTDCFASLTSYSNKSIVGIEKNIESVPQGYDTVEIMCHPGNQEEFVYLMKMGTLSDMSLGLETTFIDYLELQDT